MPHEITTSHELNHWPCLHPWVSFQVLDESGNVYPCCYSRTCLGNIHRNSFTQIWNGASAIALRKDIGEGNTERHCRPYCPALKTRHDEVGAESLNTGLSASGDVLLNAKSARQAYFERRLVADHFPLYFRAFPTNQCGMHCAMCHTWQTVPKCDFGLHQDCLGPVYAMCTIVEAIGGEPFLSNSWLRFVTHGHRAFPYVRLKSITNGMYISRLLMHHSLPHPKKWAWIGFSLDATSQRTLSHLRPGADLSTILDNLSLCIEYSMGAFPVTVLPLITTHNYHEIEDLVNRVLVQYASCRNVTVSPSIVRGAWHRQGEFTNAQLDRVIEMLDRLSTLGPRVQNLHICREMAMLLRESDTQHYVGWRRWDYDVDPREADNSVETNAHDV